MTSRSASLPIELVAMTRPAAPVLTVRYDGSERTFAAGHDVVVGRDLRADVRIAHPLISRAHLVLRFDHGRWMAIDNGSLNGMFVNGRRMPSVDITDGMTVNIGNPDGPPLSFELGRAPGVGGASAADRRRCAWPPRCPRRRGRPRRRRGAPTAGSWQQSPPSQAQPTHQRRRPPTRRAVHARNRRTTRRPGPARRRSRRRPRRPRCATAAGKPPRAASSNLATSMLKILRPGCAQRGAARRHQDRPRHRQRHRHPRRAGLAPPRHPDPDAGRHGDPSTTAASTARSSTAPGSTPRC